MIVVFLDWNQFLAHTERATRSRSEFSPHPRTAIPQRKVSLVLNDIRGAGIVRSGGKTSMDLLGGSTSQRI
jgi:hypothetical protein